MDSGSLLENLIFNQLHWENEMYEEFKNAKVWSKYLDNHGVSGSFFQKNTVLEKYYPKPQEIGSNYNIRSRLGDGDDHIIIDPVGYSWEPIPMRLIKSLKLYVKDAGEEQVILHHLEEDQEETAIRYYLEGEYTGNEKVEDHYKLVKYVINFVPAAFNWKDHFQGHVFWDRDNGDDEVGGWSYPH